MTRPESDLAFLRDPRLATHATAALPAWLWSADGKRIVWANPIGAAIFGGETPTSLAGRNFSTEPAGQQMARLSGTLPHGGAPRLERLRGFGLGFGRILTCACSRLTINDNSLVLAAATEPAGPNLPLAERVRRLFAQHAEAIAIYSTDGALLHANPAAETFLDGTRSLDALGAGALATEAASAGRASGEFAGGRISIKRLGAAASTVLVAGFAARPAGEIDISPIAQAMVRTAASPQSAARADDAAAAESAATEAATPAIHDEAELPERRHPLRFVWQMDAEGRFSLGSDEFTEVMGPKIATALGRRWSDIAGEFNLDPNEEVARAIASRETWSGITIAWPVEGSAERLEIELSGLPIFERDRTFRGYRGFGVCRDLARLAALLAARRAAPAAIPQPQTGTPAETPAAAPGNVVRFPSAPPAEAKSAALSPVEHKAFRELARQLSDRLRGEAPAAEGPAAAAAAAPAAVSEPGHAGTSDERPLLDRLPVGVLVYRLDELLYANRAFLDAAGYSTLEAFAEAGGLDNLVLGGDAGSGAAQAARSLVITTASGEESPVQGRLFTIPWEGEPALALVLAGDALATTANAAPEPPAERRAADTSGAAVLAAETLNKELDAILDIAADAAIVVDREGGILTFNRGAEALFGYDAHTLASRKLSDLLAPESQRVARDDLDQVARSALAGPHDDGREVIGRLRQGGLIPLFMTMGRISDAEPKFCAVFRDITRWKRSEEELIDARRQAERASSAKSEFLAKISHEIRTPLNAIIGFSEVMMEERFGPIGNERYRDYLKDIHASGGHLISLLNDLLDLSKIEAGKLDLNFAGLDLNDLTQQCVALMQPQANRERIIIRTSLPASVPPVVADARSVRQIVLNLLSNSIKFTRAGGQVIVSTAITDHGEVALRVRDTGVGMSEKEIQTALEPFRQLATSVRAGATGTGLGLPLTKALVEANRAHFNIRSAVDDGTLVEVTFPRARAAAE